jgi:hypothetical protein
MVEHRLGAGAEATLREALAAGPPDGYERACTLAALLEVSPAADEAAAWSAEAAETFRALGVVAVAPFA